MVSTQLFACSNGFFEFGCAFATVIECRQAVTYHLKPLGALQGLEVALLLLHDLPVSAGHQSAGDVVKRELVPSDLIGPSIRVVARIAPKLAVDWHAGHGTMSLQLSIFYLKERQHAHSF